MLFTILIVLCVLNAVTTILTFILYVRARMAPREGYPDSCDEHNARRNAALDRKEQAYRSLHFISLFLFVVLGVIIIIVLDRRADERPQVFRSYKLLASSC